MDRGKPILTGRLRHNWDTRPGKPVRLTTALPPGTLGADLVRVQLAVDKLWTTWDGAMADEPWYVRWTFWPIAKWFRWR